MKSLVRIAFVLIAGLLGSCGGIGDGSAESTPAAIDSWLVMDTMAWDQCDWAD